MRSGVLYLEEIRLRQDNDYSLKSSWPKRSG